jgi:hypothetical protein
MDEVLKTTQYVVEKSRMVTIDESEVARFSRWLIEDSVEVPQWNPNYHFCDGTEDTVSYLLVLDSLNFCFWPIPEGERWKIEYKSEELSGYYAMAAALKKAVEEKIPITNPEYLADISLDELKSILRGQGRLQILESRLEILRELGRVLLQAYGGKADRLVDEAQNSALKLARLLAEKFPSFKDISEYRGNEVFFYKRAQIFAADLYGAFKGKKWGCFSDMDGLTAFADYKLPQVLRHLGIIHYEIPLAQNVDRMILFEPGSAEEVEIRANTIWAVEMIRKKLEISGRVLRAFEIDWLLWNLGQDNAFRKRPYHRTITVFY